MMTGDRYILIFAFFISFLSFPISDISEPTATNPVIGHLYGNNKIVTISSGVCGPVYSVKSLNGSLLAEALSPFELFSQFPALEDVVKRGIAGNDASLGPESLREYRRKANSTSKPWDLW